MPYLPNDDELMADDEFDAAARRVSEELAEIQKVLFNPNGGPIPTGDDRKAIGQRKAELEVRRHELNASRGRRTYHREHRTWPDLE